MPSPVVHYIGTRLNQKLGEEFDATKLPIPIKFTSVVVEPGRLVLGLEIRGQAMAPELSQITS